LTAADTLLNGKFDIAGNVCGGWHHAFEDTARGFCIFNDIAVTAHYLFKKGVKRILILDYDAHHGDGTQRAFYRDSRVLTISIHEDPETLYPYRTGFARERGLDTGTGFNYNCPMPPYATDDLWLKPFDMFLPTVVDAFDPDFILLQMGVDGHCDCVISHLRYSLVGYQKASRFLADWVRQHRKKLLFLGGGGFVHPMLGLAWGVQLAAFAEMDIPLNVQEDAIHCAAPVESRAAEEVEEYLREHVNFFTKIAGLSKHNDN
jgi:acetoin utilization protein AcuC